MACIDPAYRKRMLYSPTGYGCMLLLLLLLPNHSHAQQGSYSTRMDNLFLFDTARKRSVPVTIYRPAPQVRIKHPILVIFNHGYNANKPRSNKTYSYITNYLASKGYFVASIQHELATDSLLPATGIPQVVRRSNWERGVANILFVMDALKTSYPKLDYTHTVLMGHSNGGDMIMLFAKDYPQLADKVISLDNRRVPLPRTAQPKVYSLRSSDQQADEGVLPTAEEQAQFGIKIVALPATLHNDMDNKATAAQRKEILTYITQFLEEPK